MGEEARGDEASESWRSAAPYLKRFFSSTPKQQARLLRRAPIDDLQRLALHHGDPSVRRNCLFFLDHYANEASTAVFAEALADPANTVRNAALHSIACESCRTAELCAGDVVSAVAGLLARDPDPDLRAKAIKTLLRLADRDRGAWEAIERAAEHDSDAILRGVAAQAFHGVVVTPSKRRQRWQQRHDHPVARSSA